MNDQSDLLGAHSVHGNGPNAATFVSKGNRCVEFSNFAQREGLTAAEAASRFMETLAVPEGPHAGQPVS